MAVIQAHPIRGGSINAIFNSQGSLGRGGLKFVRKRIIIPAIVVMEEASDGNKKVGRIRRFLVFHRGRTTKVLFLAGDLAQPGRSLIIAKSTGSLFYVRFEVEDRVAVSRQAVSCKFLKLSEKKP